MHVDPKSKHPEGTRNPKLVRPGIAVLLAERHDLLANKRVGVLSNSSGVLPDLQSSVDALIDAADVRAIFSPEHGLRGAAAPGAHIDDTTHWSGVPIRSLYGTQQAPTPDQLADLDLIVCDVADVGCRFYTYAWTVVKLIAVAAQHNVQVIIVDRPNPIGAAAEGPGVEPHYRTLVGLHDVPVRHGLTLGELARLVDHENNWNCDLEVVTCSGWQRSMPWSDTGLPWVPPSPNMPTADTALLYPGTCLGEGTNLSVGRGTAKPFEWIGAPWVDGVALADTLNALNLPGVRWRAVAFVPCAPPYAGELCEGVQPHVLDPSVFKPVEAGVALLLTLRQLHAQFAIDNQAHFDRLAGSARVRELIGRNAPLAEIVAPWQVYHARWQERAQPWLLYG